MNRTLHLSPEAITKYLTKVQHDATTYRNKIILQDSLTILAELPAQCTSLIVCDPPYNLTKQYATTTHKAQSRDHYQQWLQSWVSLLPRLLTPNGSIYVCAEWRNSSLVEEVLATYFTVRNRITWARDKGRGAHANWKNCSEDIWFATVSNQYTFNLEAVKHRKPVLAPYKVHGENRDWTTDAEGKFRMTHPSNIWHDITVPFWSMRENTPHPTQKPEKLLAKLILASSNPAELVLDPFCGSGSTCVTAYKLGRKFCGIEREAEYCAYALKRLRLARKDPQIQGYTNNTFTLKF